MILWMSGCVTVSNEAMAPKHITTHLAAHHLRDEEPKLPSSDSFNTVCFLLVSLYRIY